MTEKAGGAVPRAPLLRPGLGRLLLLAFFGLLALAPLPARAQVPPDAQWRTLETEHFRITWHEGLEDLSARAAERAERAYRALAHTFIDPPAGRIDLVLTDHADVSNGFANVNPSNRIVIFARPPVDALALSYFDDWLELVITHEVAHIFHLDRSGTPGRIIRALFGRVPGSWPVFPGRSVPEWTIEGLATYYESALSDAGRARGSYHEMVLRTAILEGRFETLGQASGTSPVWPGGSRSYIYGSLFFVHLLDRYGSDRMARFVDAVAGQWVPFRLDSAARSAFGISFTRAWQEWEEELEEEYAALVSELAEREPLTRPETLTREARVAVEPAVSPAGDRIAFVRADVRDDPQLRVMALDGSEGRKLTRVNGAATFSWEPEGGVLLAQVEWDGPYRLWSDLYRVSPEGVVRRLTREERLTHPSVHPEGGIALAVQEGAGTNRLVEVDLESGAIRALTDFLPDTHWAYPRWSPDGRWIAASRWRPGARSDILVMDRSGREQAVTNDRAVDLAPTWSADGRWLLWSSDRTGISNLFAVPFDPDDGRAGEIRQVTNVTGGALYPAPDPAGEWIFFSGYHAEGWEIERIPFEPEQWFTPFETDERFQESGERAASRYADEIEAPSTPYRPLRSLLPRYWEPIYREGRTLFGADVVSPRYGAAIEGHDLVGRHAFTLSGAWAPGSDLWEAAGEYGFFGFGNPALALSVEQLQRSGGAILAPNGQDTLFLRVRDRSARGSVTFLRQRVRNATRLTLSGRHIWQHIDVLERNLEPSSETLRRPDRRVAEGSATLVLNTSRARPLSISAEEGISTSFRGRVQRDLGLPAEWKGLRGNDRSFREMTGTLRLFRAWSGPGFANHVLALRASGGAAAGPGANAFHFGLGGAAGQSDPIRGFDVFGGSALLFPLRGYARGARHGRYAWSATAEYRIPLAIIHRGPGLVPVYFDRLSAGFFLDGGNAWGPVDAPEEFRSPARARLWSGGVELLASTSWFWTSPFTLRVGVAQPFVEGDGPTAYVRVGRSF